MRPLLDKNVLKAYLGPLRSVQKPSGISLEDFVKNSEAFLEQFPKDTARVKTLLKKNWKKEVLEEKVNSAYPLVHERVLHLAAEFIQYKKQNGTSIERKLYSEMDLVSFFDRLLKKRPYVFYCANDKYMLRNEKTGFGGFEKIGTQSEDASLCLEEYLSYDEMKISALVSVSSLSCFINDGNRKNKGEEGEDGEYEKEGVIIGAVGARLKKKSVMEWQDCIITREQNCERSGYGNMWASSLPGMWARMWGSSLPLWDEVDPKQTEYLNFGVNKYFNVTVYRRRIQLTAEIILTEATWRAHLQGCKAYIHVVGLGLGVWRAMDAQEQIFVDAWGMALGQVDTTHISDVDFSWIKVEECKGVKEGEKLHGVTLHFTTRSLHDPVPDGKLLVCSYAWDGNSLPGNEYWLDKLSSTGDSAAACSSQVAEIHNTFINPSVCGANLHITSKHGVEHIAQYAQRMTVDAEDKPQVMLGEISEVPSLIEKEDWTKIGEQGSSGTEKGKEPSPQKRSELKEKDEVHSVQQQQQQKSSKDGEQFGVSHSEREKKNPTRSRGQKGESYHRRGSDSPLNRNITGEVLAKNGDKHKHQKSYGENKRDHQGSHVNSGNGYIQQGTSTDIGYGNSWADDRVNGFTDNREYGGKQVQEKTQRGNRIYEGDHGFSRNHLRSTSGTNRRNSSKDGFHNRSQPRKPWNTEFKEDHNQANRVVQQGTRKNNSAKEKLQKPLSERQDEQAGQRQKGTLGWASNGVEKNLDYCYEDRVPTQNAQSSQMTNRLYRYSARHDRQSSQRQGRPSASKQDRHPSRQDRNSASRQDEYSSSVHNGYSHRQNSHSKHKHIEHNPLKHDTECAERHTQFSRRQEASSTCRQSMQRQNAHADTHSWAHQKSSKNSQTETCPSQTKDAESHRTQHPQEQEAHLSQVEEVQPPQVQDTQLPQIWDGQPSQGKNAQFSQEQDAQPLVHFAHSPQTLVAHVSPVQDKHSSPVQEAKPSHLQDTEASKIDCAGPLQTNNTLIAGTQASPLIQTQDTQSSCIQTSESLAPADPQVQSLTNPAGQAFELSESSPVVDRDMMSQSKEMEPLKTPPLLPSPEKAEPSVEKESYLWCEYGGDPLLEVVEINEEKTEQQGKSQFCKAYSSRNLRCDYLRDAYSPHRYHYSGLEGPHTSGSSVYPQNMKGYRENGRQCQGRGRQVRGQKSGKGDSYSQTSMESGKPRHGGSGRGRDNSHPPNQHPGNHPHSFTKDRKQLWPMDRDLKGYSDITRAPKLGYNPERHGQGRGKSYRNHRNIDNYPCRIFTSSNNSSNGRHSGRNQQYLNGFDDKGNYSNCGSPGRGSLNFESARRDPSYSDDVRKHPFNNGRFQFSSSSERKKSAPTECNLAQREKVPNNVVDTIKEDCSSGVNGLADIDTCQDEWKDSTRNEKNITDEWADSVRSKEIITATDTSNADPVQGEQNVFLVATSKAEESFVSNVDHSIGGGKEQVDLSSQIVVEDHVHREEKGQEANDYNGDGGPSREPKFADSKAEQQPCRERVASVDDSRVWCPEFEPQKVSWHQENLVEKLQPMPPQNAEIRQLTQSPAVAFQDQQSLLQHSHAFSPLSQSISQMPQTIPQLPPAIPPFSQGMAQQTSQPVPPMSQSFPHAVAPLSQAMPHYSQTVSHFTQPVVPSFPHTLLQPYPSAIAAQFSPSLQLSAQALPHHLQARPPLNASRQSFSQQHTQSSQQASQTRMLHQQGQPVQKPMAIPWLLQQQQQQPPPPLNYDQHDTFPPPSEHTSYSSSPHCIPIDDSQFVGKHPRLDLARQNMMSYTQESPLSNSQSQSSQFSESFWPPTYHSNQLVIQPTHSPGLNQVQQFSDFSPMPSLVTAGMNA